MQLPKLLISYLLCCAFSLASSTNKCSRKPNTNCSDDYLQVGWFSRSVSYNFGSAIKECYEAVTCSNSTYFESRQECDDSCALKCPKPVTSPPYNPNTVVINEEAQEGNGVTYSSFSSCGRGYILIGSSERVCNNNGNWSGEEPGCYDVSISVKRGEERSKLEMSNILEVEKGQSVMISCDVRPGNPPIQSMVWRKIKDNKVFTLPIKHDMREGVDIMKGYIYIQIDKASSVHAGNYSCMALNNSKLSRNFTLKVNDPKKAPKIETAKIMTEGGLRLVCFARGTPAPKVEWFKDQLPVLAKQGDVFYGEDSTLVNIKIDNPDKRHVGTYVCRAENKHGIAKSREYVVTPEAIGLTDVSSSGDDSHFAQPSHIPSCALCPNPNGQALIVKTCKESNTVVKAQLIVNGTSNSMFRMKKATVIKGSASRDLNMLKLTDEAMQCDCPTLNSHSWYVLTGTINEDMLIVGDTDTACQASSTRLHKLESQCNQIQ